MKHFITTALGAALSLTLLAGCLSSGPIEPTRYFTIAPEFPIEAGAPGGKSLGIRPLVGARPYKLEIAYTKEPNRLAYYPRAAWAELPATMVNRALTDALLRTKAFSDVGDAANMNRPDYILTGELRRFEADFTGEQPVAVVALSADVRGTGNGENVWQGHFTIAVPLETSVVSGEEPLASDGAVTAVAQGLSKAVAELVTRISTELQAQ